MNHFEKQITVTMIDCVPGYKHTTYKYHIDTTLFTKGQLASKWDKDKIIKFVWAMFDNPTDLFYDGIVGEHAAECEFLSDPTVHDVHRFTLTTVDRAA